MERIVGGIFIEAAMPSPCSHSCRQFLTIIQAFAHTESEKHSPPSVAKISARYRGGLGAIEYSLNCQQIRELKAEQILTRNDIEECFGQLTEDKIARWGEELIQ